MKLGSLETASEWSNFAAVGFGLAAAFSAAFVVYFSGRLGRAKDAELARFQTQAAADIANANARAEEAHRAAAAANERARALEVEAAEQRERAAKAEKDLWQLTRRVAARGLAADQRKKLVVALAAAESKGRVQVVSIFGDGESYSFAAEIMAALNEAGWSVAAVDQALQMPSPIGLLIQFRSPSLADAPAQVASLIAAFSAAGLALVPAQNVGLGEGDVHIVVGNKPQ